MLIMLPVLLCQCHFFSLPTWPKVKTLMEAASMPDFAQEMRRIQLATGCTTQQEMGAYLEVSEASISDASRRGSIPPDWHTTLRKKKVISQNWILHGKWEKRFQNKQNFSSKGLYSRADKTGIEHITSVD